MCVTRSTWGEVGSGMKGPGEEEIRAGEEKVVGWEGLVGSGEWGWRW